MANTTRKAIFRQLDGPLTWGYLPSAGFVKTGTVELLDPAGRAVTLPLASIKTICYVRDFNLDDPVEPEKIGRRAFQGRPRGEGLWIKLQFVSRDTVEGLAHFDLALLDAIYADQGITLTPPDPKSNTQRIFVPRTALASVQVMGWVTSPSRQKSVRSASEKIQGGCLISKLIFSISLGYNRGDEVAANRRRTRCRSHSRRWAGLRP